MQMCVCVSVLRSVSLTLTLMTARTSARSSACSWCPSKHFPLFFFFSFNFRSAGANSRRESNKLKSFSELPSKIMCSETRRDHTQETCALSHAFACVIHISATIAALFSVKFQFQRNILTSDLIYSEHRKNWFKRWIKTRVQFLLLLCIVNRMHSRMCGNRPPLPQRFCTFFVLI